eukprot:TRINITY_DN1898_c0_g1_i3.p1 TRINITY_DN1898_c0_g1~~TRINITY_DN1898_c0_g1_i3.p1  ORF type:complete len:249 (-),score=30.84 TRINITY_DN1898_c0_g1_i3:592-1338(-)
MGAIGTQCISRFLHECINLYSLITCILLCGAIGRDGSALCAWIPIVSLSATAPASAPSAVPAFLAALLWRNACVLLRTPRTAALGSAVIWGVAFSVVARCSHSFSVWDVLLFGASASLSAWAEGAERVAGDRSRFCNLWRRVSAGRSRLALLQFLDSLVHSQVNRVWGVTFWNYDIHEKHAWKCYVVLTKAAAECFGLSISHDAQAMSLTAEEEDKMRVQSEQYLQNLYRLMILYDAGNVSAIWSNMM